MAMLRKAQMNARASGISTTIETLDEYDLGGIDCTICNNSGTVYYKKNEYLYSKPCECMKRRINLRNIRKSGLQDMMERYTFDSFRAEDESRKYKKMKAMEFAAADSGWLYIFGQPGSGKTHLCTAICGQLIDAGKSVYYMIWRDELAKIKAQMVESKEDYLATMKRMKNVEVLYIDDFFKGKITEADINIGFEIINARYNNSHQRTVISSELPIDRILDLDEALGSRIFERCRDYYIESPHENWRLR